MIHLWKFATMFSNRDNESFVGPILFKQKKKAQIVVIKHPSAGLAIFFHCCYKNIWAQCAIWVSVVFNP